MDTSLLELIRQRRSCRSYTTQPLTREQLDSIVEAGCHAPFAEADSRHFCVVSDAAMIERLNREAKTAGRQLGPPHIAALAQNEDYHCLYRAPAVILVFARADAVAGEADAAAAIENMLLAAQSLGLGACWVFFAALAFWLPSADRLLADLGLSAAYKPIAAVTLGYAATEKLPPKVLGGSVNYIE